MTEEKLFVIVITVTVIVGIGIIQLNKYRHVLKHAFINRLKIFLETVQRGANKPQEPSDENQSRSMTSEEKSKAELLRLQRLIENRKQIAWDSDISHHLWSFYKSNFRNSNLNPVDRLIRDGEWYDVNILHSSSRNGQNKFEFELMGGRYKFIDDEENQGWCDNIKFFSLFLYDELDRCLIEIPMKLKIDKWGRNYSILSDGPKAFIPNGWIKDFINVILKHQRIHNEDIREQKHRERIGEIEDLKNRFGLSE